MRIAGCAEMRIEPHAGKRELRHVGLGDDHRATRPQPCHRRRIGHSNPTITLSVYARLFGDTDRGASTVVEAALAGLLTE